MKRVAFVGLTLALVLLGSIVTLFALDVWARHRHPLLNRYGYAGPILSAKQPNEYRIAVIGGSTVLGYGLASWRDAFPAYLETDLQPDVRVANLGYNNQGSYSFAFTIQQYAYLHPDLIVLYEGYNDLNGFNMMEFRQHSFVFRWTGYFPLLPMVAAEKAMLLRVGDLRAAYAGKKIAFTPTFTQRGQARVLEAIKMLGEGGPVHTAETDNQLGFYLANISRAITEAHQRHAAVIMVGQPRINAAHGVQQAALKTMLCRDHQDVSYVDLSATVSLSDPAICWDGIHLTPSGNQIIARALAEAIRAYRVQPRSSCS